MLTTTPCAELCRCKKVKYFIESIGMTHCTKWKAFVKDLGAQLTKELKVVTKEERDMHIKSLNMNKIQPRKLSMALEN